MLDDNNLNNPKDWAKTEGKLSKEFKFDNFIEAFGFITKVALESEKMNHHPDIIISYNKVNIKLITHDTNQITKKDIDLAKIIDKLNE
jgi:4a-hydroxytetrahydrobiopterin dehydratase